MEKIVLIVHEANSPSSAYRMCQKFVPTLEYINGQTFKFHYDNITCDDKSIMITHDISKLLRKFKAGRFTIDWNDIAERINIFEDESPSICISDTYEIFIA